MTGCLIFLHPLLHATEVPHFEDLLPSSRVDVILAWALSSESKWMQFHSPYISIISHNMSPSPVDSIVRHIIQNSEYQYPALKSTILISINFITLINLHASILICQSWKKWNKLFTEENKFGCLFNQTNYTRMSPRNGPKKKILISHNGIHVLYGSGIK